ncbi:hypothetical protein [Ruegeria atlantica]|nr:hypothetical protein [Ruegeria atlantica]
MNAFLAAVAAMAVIAFSAPIALETMGYSAAASTSGSAVRLD